MSTDRVVVLSSIGSVVLLALVCCAPQDVVVADVHGLDGGGGDGHNGRPFGKECTTNDECGLSSFCERITCGDATGVCQVRPTFCEDLRAETCGCNGVTFWNDCLRRQRGEAAAVPGLCTSASCGGPMKKPCDFYGAYCARLLPQPDAMCDGPIKDMIDGFCWVLPQNCPAEDAGGPPGVPKDPRWVSCMGPHPPPMDCLSTCDAIRSQEPRRAPAMMECPP